MRELNPDLFSSEAQPYTRYLDPQKQKDLFLDLELKISELKAQFTDKASSDEGFRLQVKKYLEKVVTYQEGFSSELRRLDHQCRSLQEELQQKTTLLQQKMEDQKGLESRLQEILDRQQSVVKTYELRTHQLQKTLEEKNALLLSFQSLLAETRSELIKMKRDFR